MKLEPSSRLIHTIELYKRKAKHLKSFDTRQAIDYANRLLFLPTHNLNSAKGLAAHHLCKLASVLQPSYGDSD